MEDVQRVIEGVARNSYGRLVAYLSSHTRDVASAEDALSEALVAALTAWPRDGIPAKPEAWLLTTARHRLIDKIRHERVQAESEPTLQLMADQAVAIASSDDFPDERLKLLFVCAHPAIDAAVHTPLMLQTVLGIDAAHIAQAFLVSPATMAQRLVRAKTKIRDAGIPFEVPDSRDLPDRLEAVLEAIYAAYGIGWEDAEGVDPRGHGLADEAIWLARVLLQRMPNEPEARGLLALMLYCEARRSARRGADGQYIPLSDQDPHQWSPALIGEAEGELSEAAKLNRPGRFQLEAAIQSVHAERAQTGRIDWKAIATFYQHLIQLSPALGARVGQAAAVAEANGPEAGLSLLDAIDHAAISNYQPYWAVRAHLLQRIGKKDEAVENFDRAIGLTEDPAVRGFLLERRGWVIGVPRES